jgi:hypothetical protein
VFVLCPRVAREMASGQPVFLSLSFIRWRREWMVSLTNTKL